MTTPIIPFTIDGIVIDKPKLERLMKTVAEIRDTALEQACFGEAIDLSLVHAVLYRLLPHEPVNNVNPGA